MNDSLETFRDLLARDGDPAFLFEAALQIAVLVEGSQPPGWRELARDTVRGFGRRFRESANSLHAPNEHALLCRFANYFSTELGFHGDTESYHEPGNSSLLHVLSMREGLPITLSVLFMEVARHAGLEVWGIAAPRHFVTATRADNSDWIVDPFHHSRVVSRDDYLSEMAEELHLSADLLLPALHPAPPRLILKRMLKNLLVSFSQKGDASALMETLDWAIILDPADGEDLLNRGILRLRMGRYSDGARDLLHLMEITPGDHPSRTHIQRELNDALLRLQGGK